MVNSLSDRIRQLEHQIDYHDEKYWKDNDPEIPDSEYHGLVKELQNLDPDNIRINRRHSSLPPSSKRQKVVHEIPLLSLAKKYTVEEIIDWCISVSRGESEIFKIEPKLDGISSIFRNGILATRGDDGIHGDDITSKAPLIFVEAYDGDFPLTHFKRDARGEIVMKKSVFEERKDVLLRKDGKPYKYPRSAVVGLLLRDDVNLNLENILTFAEYQKFSMVKPLKALKTMSWEYLISEVQEWDYPTDGLVIKLADEKYSASLGVTSHHPKGQMSLKYGNPKGKTVIHNVIWSMGKDTLTPVGVIDPIILAGAEISRVSLHNARFILDRDIKINDTIIIERAGEIIPHVIGVIPGENRKDIILTCCPMCGGELIYNDPELYCANVSCSGKLVRNLSDAVKRIGIDNLGESTIEKLIDIGILSLADIFELTLEDILELPGFAEISANNLLSEIKKVKSNEVEDWRFLSSLNIKGIGSSVCKKILTEVNLMELYDMNIDQMKSLPNIGTERAFEIRTFLNNNRDYIFRLFKMLKIKTTKGVVKLGSICFTGKSDKPREYWISLTEGSVYSFSNSVNKNLTFLVTDDVDKSGGKINKAREFGVEVITYDQFMEMLKTT